MDRSLRECEWVADVQRRLFFSDVFCPIARASWLLSLARPRTAEAQFREALRRWSDAGQGIVVPHSKTMWQTVYSDAATLRRIGIVRSSTRTDSATRMARASHPERTAESQSVRTLQDRRSKASGSYLRGGVSRGTRPARRVVGVARRNELARIPESTGAGRRGVVAPAADL